MRVVPRMIIAVMVLAFFASAIVADEILSEPEATAKIEQLGGKVNDGRPVTVSVNLEPIPVAVIPFWSIVIPLSLISAYLLLSKQRSTNRKSRSV